MSSILPELASSQNRKDEGPNKALSQRLVDSMGLVGIREAADNLNNNDRKIRIDCLAVLEQVGLLEPALIEDYLEDFYNLALSDDNRLVWAAMINIALIADRKPDAILEKFAEIVKIINKGTVITQDNGIKILARAGATSLRHNNIVCPYLMSQLRNCRPKSLPQYAESIQVAVRPENKTQFLEILTVRIDELSTAQKKGSPRCSLVLNNSLLQSS